MILKTSVLHTITAGGTSQLALPECRNRRYLLVQNQSTEDLWVNFGQLAADAAPSIRIAAGDALHFAAGVAPDAEIYVFAATTGSAFAIWGE